MNTQYTYPEIFLWEQEAWRDRDSEIRPLLDHLTELGHTHLRPRTISQKYTDRTDGTYDAKSNVLRLPDVMQPWEDMGLRVHITSMGFVCWIALVPRDVAAEPEVLFVPHSCDLKNRGWAMQTLDYYARYGKIAAQRKAVVLLYCQGGAKGSGIFMDILLELSAIFHIGLSHLMLDLSILPLAGEALPEGAFSWNGIPVTDMTDRWHSRVGHQYICSEINRHNPEFDFQRMKHSTLGREIARSMYAYEYSYSSTNDPGLIRELSDRGLAYGEHFCQGERYLTLTPKGAAGKLPLLICMKEVRSVMPFQSLIGFQFYSEFIEIAACGEMMLLFFAMETADDNELLLDILAQVKAAYPVDEGRIYIAGQSHNGYLALEFARRHPDIIAATAQLNDRHGIGAPSYSVDSLKMTDEMLAEMAKWDMPLINICGEIENVFPHITPGTPEEDNAVDSFHRRLKAFRCPDRSDQEIRGAKYSPDIATRKNGVPGDRTEVRYAMGHEIYVTDVQNVDGKWHLRFATLENLPHMITPDMAELSWSFLRRFRRLKDGSIEEIL